MIAPEMDIGLWTICLIVLAVLVLSGLLVAGVSCLIWFIRRHD